jgi:hypothetical protein
MCRVGLGRGSVPRHTGADPARLAENLGQLLLLIGM